MTDVLVVGAGPAGSAAAIHLAREGYQVTLVDRARFPRGKPCGEYYNPECVRLLRELDVLDACLRHGARWVRALHLSGPDGDPLQVRFDDLPVACGPALSLGREVLDTLLVQRARAEGVDVREGVLVRAPLVEAGRVVGARVEVDGEAREIRSRLTLAADGLHSRFARLLGVGAGDGGRRKLGVTARYAALESGEWMEIGARGGCCCGLVIRGGEANLGMAVDHAHAREMGGDPARFFAAALEQFPELRGRLAGGPTRVRTIGPLTWRTRRQAVDGCLFLGDAAGFYDPFTGQGVTFALLTAGLAAETAAAALQRRDVSRRVLRRYEWERRATLQPRLWVQQAIQAVIARPEWFGAVHARLRRNPEVARTLIGVVADVLPPERVLAPGFVAGLLGGR